MSGANIETKVRCPDLEAVAQRAESHGARLSGVLDQRDTYFDVPSGRLKVRALEGRTPTGATTAQAELVAYDRTDTETACVSSYTREVVDDPDELLRRLADEYRMRGVVVKRRELWLLDRTRIHLDRVEGLGDFVELETVAETSVDDDLWSEHARIAGQLGLDTLEPVAGSYVDLLEEKLRSSSP